MTQSLLPPNATQIETAVEAALTRLDAIPVAISDLWNPDTCPVQFLPLLAWAFSVDTWNAAWPEDEKRDTIRASIAIHRMKGTRASVRAALDAAGFRDAEIIERYASDLHDGTIQHDGTRTHDGSDHWAEWRLNISRPITAEQAIEVRRIAEEIAPIRAVLKEIDFTQAALIHDGSHFHDGTFNHGTI